MDTFGAVPSVGPLAEFTITVTFTVAVPPGPVAVKTYACVAEGYSVIGRDAIGEPSSTRAVAPVTVALSDKDCPALIVAGVALKPAIVGAVSPAKPGLAPGPLPPVVMIDPSKRN